MDISLPLIIVEDITTIILYRKVLDAELNMEAIDVEAGLYKGYDAKGRQLEISAENGNVSISTSKLLPAEVNKLEKLLRYHLQDIGIDLSNVNHGDLHTLLVKARVFQFIEPSSGIKILWKFFKDFIKVTR